MEGKVVLITGAGSGFGAETSVILASMGCNLALVDKASLQGTMEQCFQKGLAQERILLLEFDLSDIERLKEIVDKTVERFGKLDVLINNAGIGSKGSSQEETSAEYDAVMTINTKAPFMLSQHAIPHLIQSKGNIVNVSSAFGLRAQTISTVYCISKSAVNHLTQCAALELAPLQVRVNAVNPGHVKTAIYKSSSFGSDEKIDAYLENLRKLYPMGRIGTTQEIAKAIVFLADNTQSSFITGVCLPVDGGFCLGPPQV